MTRTTLPFDRILDLTILREPPPGAGPRDASALTNAEKDSVIEVALLMATANGDSSDDELASVADLVAHVRGKRPTPSELLALQAAIEKRIAGSVEERVQAIAKTLVRPVARELAYKAAYAIRVADLESNPDEEDLAEILVEALELGDGASDLESEVNEALIVPGD